MNVAINRQPTKAEGGNHKATPTKMKQTNCHSAASAHSDLQAGRGAPHAEDGLCTTAGPISSASKRAYDDLFARNLTSSEVEALDAPFPATTARTGRRLFSDDGAGSRGQ